MFVRSQCAFLWMRRTQPTTKDPNSSKSVRSFVRSVELRTKQEYRRAGAA
jgi:hypothetical protein